MITEEFENKIWIYFQTNLSPKTRKEYWNIIKNFDKITQKDPLHMDAEASDKYYKYLVDQVKKKKLSYSTALTRLSSMRSICNFIEFNQHNHGNIDYTNYLKDYSLPDIDKTIEKEAIPSSAEINTILELMISENDLKAFLITSLVVKCGLTNSEVCSLDYNNIMCDTKGDLCIQIPSRPIKGKLIKPARVLHIPDDISKILDNYININKITDGCLFINKRKNRIKIRDTERMLLKYVNKCIEDKKISTAFTMQSLRHASFSYMLQGGATYEQVASYGGISTKWMNRYHLITSQSTENQAVNYSVITINYKI